MKKSLESRFGGHAWHARLHATSEAYLARVRSHHATEVYQKAMRKRQVWMEPLFTEAKD